MSSFFRRIAQWPWKRIALFTGSSVLVLLISSVLVYAHYFGPVDSYADTTQFIVAPGTTADDVVSQVSAAGLVRSELALKFAIFQHAQGRKIRPGGYTVSKSMDVMTLAKVLTDPPAMAFVTFPPSIRKEQMGDLLADALGWNDAQKTDWNTTATTPDPSFAEGVYYPDTYLIPSDQTPAQIAARMRGRFTEVFQPYAIEAQRKGIAWNKVLILASIVDRESAKNDKALVAGILWNRLNIGMKLQADATLQYAKGKEGNWWPQPLSADKYIVSAYNTYQHTGLPPHPIDNPSMESIAAVLDPVKTNCLFYLHDTSHHIHCSPTYSGQVKNVNLYLK